MIDTNRLTRVITEEDIRSVREEGKLSSIAMRIPTSCNLKCGYCYGKIESRENSLLFEEIKHVLQQGAELGARTVSVVGEGEPLLYPHFREFVEYVDSLGMVPTIYSNCTLVDDKIAQFMYKHNVTMIGKQNALTPKKQSEISGCENAGAQVLIGLGILMNTGFATTKPSRFGIHTVVIKDNLRELLDMWRNWRRQNILPQVQALVYPSRRQEPKYFDYYRQNAPSPRAIRVLFEELSKIDRVEFGINWDPLLAYPIAPDSCRVHCGSVGITQEGNVQICNFTEDSLGNIRKNSLREILLLDKVKRIRTVGEELGYPGGRYGCRAHAFNFTGDRFGRDPFYDSFLSNGV